MTKIEEIRSAGQSLWYDNIERAKLLDGSLAHMIKTGVIRGITSNPSIFQKAIASSKDYDITLKPMSWAGLDSENIFWQLAIEDIQAAAQLFLPIYEESDGADGFVSLEVNPLIAHDTERTIAEAARLWQRVNMPNLMIKIPATKAGIPAIRKCIGDGLNINVTLIFSLNRYVEVIDAYLSGLEDRVNRGESVKNIASVASFFVSRIDTNVDKLLQEKVNLNKLSTYQYESLAGKTAIANARLAYQQFEVIFSSTRFQALQKHGARAQRPLWASTSTKNPAYRDVFYVEELIAPNSVNTVPPATLDAFLDHGSVDVRIYKELDAAENLFNQLEKHGIFIEEVTTQLEAEGVKAFADSYKSLLEAVEKRRITAVSEIAPLNELVKNKVNELDEADFSQRLFRKDPSLWTDDPQGQSEITKRMDWLEAPIEAFENPPMYAGIGRELVSEGFTNAVLLGMGGSSLAAEVLSKLLAPAALDSGLRLSILDSTDPLQIEAITVETPALQTLYIVASKSGTTGEINAFLDYFWERTIKAGNNNPGQQFIAITDPGTRLNEIALERGFRAVYNANPQVGGRYSALTTFGLVPAAIMGIDLHNIIKNACNMAQLCLPQQPIHANPGIVLGVIIGTAALNGKDKLTLITEGKWDAFGDWLEQLVAESSGKDGKGILPVTGEPELSVDSYSRDRLFVYLNLDSTREPFVDSIAKAGHPLIKLHIDRDEVLSGQFYLWEVAVATACSIIGVNSFDQPDVQDAKLRTISGLDAYRKNGSLPMVKPSVQFPRAKILDDFVPSPVPGKLLSFIEEAVARDRDKIEYVAINAFLPRNQKNEEVLQYLRKEFGEKFHLATTLGFGPRYLHSTGQLHKGGPNTGFFLLITAQRQDDINIPGQGLSFGVMQRAQAIGDMQALKAKQRSVLWVDLDEPNPAILTEE